LANDGLFFNYTNAVLGVNLLEQGNP